MDFITATGKMDLWRLHKSPLWNEYVTNGSSKVEKIGYKYANPEIQGVSFCTKTKGRQKKE